MDNDPFFVTGGTLPLHAGSYIVRDADRQLFDSLRRGDFCYVLNTRQMGKSSLMVRTARRLREEGCRVAVLDLTAIGQNLTVEQWYFGLLTRTANQTGQSAELVAFWRSNREMGPMQRYMEALRQVLLAGPRDDAATLSADDRPLADRLVIFVDEIDAVRSLSFSADEFFAGIRECYNRRPQDEAFNRITFCLLGVASPTDLVQDTRISPFNIGERIELSDFTAEEAEPLTRGLNADGTDPAESAAGPRASRRLLTRVLYWTGGHPYMTQRLCRAVAAHLADSALPTARREVGSALVDTLCHELFLSKSAQEIDDNLAFVRNRLLRGEVDTSALLDMYREIRQGRRVPDEDTNPLCSLLRLSGVVTRRSGRLVRRNRIYDYVFDVPWVVAHLPGAELRRQQKAYRRGVWRTASLGGAILATVFALAAFAADRAIEARRASRLAATQEAISRSELSRAYVAQGVRLMEAGDSTAALAPFTDALRLDVGNPARAAMHRRRIASALAVAPTISRLWGSDTPLRWATFSPDRRWVATAGEDGLAHVYDAISAAELPLVMRHDGPISFVAFNPNSDRLATCADDATTRIWDLSARRRLYTLPLDMSRDGDRHLVYAAWNGDGSRLAILSGRHLDIWEFPKRGSDPSGVPRRVVSYDDDPGSFLTGVAFSPKTARLALAAANDLEGEFDPATGRQVSSFGSEELGGLYSNHHLAYTKDGARILVAGGLGGHGNHPGAAIVDVRHATRRLKGERLVYFPTHDEAYSAAFSPDERRVATGSGDGEVRLWDAATGSPLRTAPMVHGSRVVDVEFSDDGRRLVSASLDGTARVWDADTGAPICAPLHHASALLVAQFARDSNHVLTASRDGTARIWTVPAPDFGYAPPVTFAGAVEAIDDVTHVAGVFRGSTAACVKDLETDRVVLPTANGLQFAHCVSIGRGRALLYGGVTDVPTAANARAVDSAQSRNVQVVNTDSGQPITPVYQADWACPNRRGDQLILGDRAGTFHLVGIGATSAPSGSFFSMPANSSLACSPFTPDGAGFLSREGAQAVRLRSARTGAPLTPPMPVGNIDQWEFSPDGRYLFTWREIGGAVRLWHIPSGTPAVDSALHGDALVSGSRDKVGVAFSTDGRLALTHDSTHVLLWPLDGARISVPRKISVSRTHFVAFGRDNANIVLAGPTSCLWRTRTLLPVTLSNDPGLSVVRAEFSPDQGHVLAIYEDGTALLFDGATGVSAIPPLMGRIVMSAFSSDGAAIATGTANGLVRVWDSTTGEPISPPLRAPNRITNLKFSSDGRRLAALSSPHGGSDIGRSLTIWNLPEPHDSDRELEALGALLSGERMDARLGPMPVSAVALLSAWDVLRGKTKSSP